MKNHSQFLKRLVMLGAAVFVVGWRTAVHHAVGHWHSYRYCPVHCQRRLLPGAATTTSLFSSAPPSRTSQDSELYEKLRALSSNIRRHEGLYYNAESAPEITDDEFDLLVKEEADLCRRYPHLLERLEEESGLGIEATRYGGVRVGAPTGTPEPGGDRYHISRMLSLDNCHSPQEVLDWLGRMYRIWNKAQALEIDRDEDDDSSSSPQLKMEFLSEPKLDGLSLSLRYLRSSTNRTAFDLAWATTRGDGNKGKDVTRAIQNMSSIPREVRLLHGSELGAGGTIGEVEVRGEVILPKSTFDTWKEDEEFTFSNPRNAASGILMRKEGSVQLAQELKFYAYDVVVSEVDASTVWSTATNMREWLESQRFDVPMPTEITEIVYTNEDDGESASTLLDQLEPMLSYHNSMYKQRQDNELESDIDGVVYKINDIQALRSLLGSSNQSPRWAMAHKFPAELVRATLDSIQVQVGRTGVLTPVAHFEPAVTLHGVNISKATLHNFAHMQSLLGGTVSSVRSGTKVWIRRAGDVIPQVVKVEREETTDGLRDGPSNLINVAPPTTCPACHSPTEFETADEKVLRCTGPPLACPPRAVVGLGHAFGRDALDLKGLSKAKLEQLWTEGLVKAPHDVLQFNESLAERILELRGWGPKSVQNLEMAATKRRQDGVSLGRYLHSLGIRHVGKHMSETLAQAYGNVDAFLQDLEQIGDARAVNQTTSVWEDRLSNVNGVGPTIINSLQTFAETRESVEAARALARIVPVHSVLSSVTVAEDKGKGDNASDGFAGTSVDPTTTMWAGKRIVFTGKLPVKRSQAESFAKDVLGAKSTSSQVTKTTDVVVYVDEGSKKYTKAVELGIELVPADEFMGLMDNRTDKNGS